MSEFITHFKCSLITRTFSSSFSCIWIYGYVIDLVAVTQAHIFEFRFIIQEGADLVQF